MPQSRPDRTLHRQGGFTLIEAGIAMAIIGLLVAGGLMFGGGILSRNQVAETEARLDRIEEALVAFGTTNRRLPCPSIATSGTVTGREDRDAVTGECNSSQNPGVVPWRTLGLGEDDAVDAWGRLVTYKVYDDPTSGLVRDGGLDLSPCDNAATSNGPADECTDGESSRDYLVNKGFDVYSGDEGAGARGDFANPVEGTGAAYVLIGHGANGFFARLPGSGAEVPGSGATAEESANRAALDDTAFQPVAPRAASFDDQVRWKTILRLAEDAGLGPNYQPMPGAGGGGGGGGGSGPQTGTGGNIDLNFTNKDFDTAGNSGNFSGRDDLTFKDGDLAPNNAQDIDLRISAQGGNNQVSYDKTQQGQNISGQRTLGTGHGNTKGRLSGSETLTLDFAGTYSHFGATIHFFTGGDSTLATFTAYNGDTHVGTMSTNGISGHDVTLTLARFSTTEVYDRVVLSVSGGAVIGLRSVTAQNPQP